jgi:hypothetical protein
VTADLFALRALCMYLIQCGIEKFGKKRGTHDSAARKSSLGNWKNIEAMEK